MAAYVRVQQAAMLGLMPPKLPPDWHRGRGRPGASGTIAGANKDMHAMCFAVGVVLGDSAPSRGGEVRGGRGVPRLQLPASHRRQSLVLAFSAVPRNLL